MTLPKGRFFLDSHDTLRQTLIYHPAYRNHDGEVYSGLFDLTNIAVLKQQRRWLKHKDFTMASILSNEDCGSIAGSALAKIGGDAGVISRLQYDDISDISSPESSKENIPTNDTENVGYPRQRLADRHEHSNPRRLQMLFRPWVTESNREEQVPKHEYSTSSPRKSINRYNGFVMPSQVTNSEGKYNKRTRTVFTPWQLKILEDAFALNQFLNGEEKMRLAQVLQIKENTVKIWFQNRRMKFRRQSKSAELT